MINIQAVHTDIEWIQFSKNFVKYMELIGFRSNREEILNIISSEFPDIKNENTAIDIVKLIIYLQNLFIMLSDDKNSTDQYVRIKFNTEGDKKIFDLSLDNLTPQERICKIVIEYYKYNKGPIIFISSREKDGIYIGKINFKKYEDIIKRVLLQ